MEKQTRTPVINDQERAKKISNTMHPMLLMVIVVLFCAVLTYILPAGQYQRVEDEAIGKEIILAGSFTNEQRTPATPMEILTSLTRGLQYGADVIFFLFIIGGMFAILNGTGALSVGIANLLRKLRGRELLLIPICMVFFGLGSSFLGNFEEFLVFVPLMLACCMTAGFDSLTAVGIIFMAATAGYAGAIANPFTIGNALQIAGLETASAMSARVVLFVLLEVASIGYLLWYAHAVRKNPRISGAYVYDQEYNRGKCLDLDSLPALNLRKTLVILVFALGIVFAVWGVITQGYYVDELAAVFLVVGVVGGIVGGLRAGEICNNFVKGCHDMLLPGLMIGLAHAARILLEDAHVMDSILRAIAGLLTNVPNVMMAGGMFVAHEAINVFIPSGSAQAFATMPLMVQLADNVGLSRQVAVIAYQLGDAFTNILAPTGGEILAALAICRVPFSKWIRFLLPLFIIWWVISFAFLAVATQIGL